MCIDEIMAILNGQAINVDTDVDMANLSNWDAACLIGKTVSLALNGYEDHFDGMDWEDAARELRHAAKHENETFTRRSIITALYEMGYDLKEYS